MLKVVELFSGYGSQALALKRLGIDFTSTQCDIDKYAVQAYNQIHGETLNLGDITKVDENKLDKDIDLLTYSSPCFTEDTLVYTENGYASIKDITIGTKVLTHDGTFKPVLNKYDNGLKQTIALKAMGTYGITCTPEHKFYVREKQYQWVDKGRKSKEGWKKKDKIRCFSTPKWKEAKNLSSKDYLGFPINNKAEIPAWDGIVFNWTDGRKDRYKNQITPLLNNTHFWWLIGRYVADGWQKNNAGIIIACGKSKYNDFIQKLKKLNIHYTIAEERTTFKFNFPIKELNKFVQPIGKGAINKRIPPFILNLPVNLLSSFIDGYMSGDGCFSENRFKATSVSEQLLLGLGQAVAKVYHQPYSLYKTIRHKTAVIEGRTVNQKDTYQLCWKTNTTINDKAFFEDGFIWFPFSKLKDNGVQHVYDIEVQDNHSFTANNVIVHNCQDFSASGLQKGGEKGSGTRSSLLWECERIISATRPKYLLMENVKNLVGKKFYPCFQSWLQTLDTLGYANYWKVLNAKDYGVPQNRERVFVVSIRKDINQGYTFPEPIKLEKRLKDILEENVDEKYYLSDKLIQGFLTKIERNRERSTGFNKQINICDQEGVPTTLTSRYHKCGITDPYIEDASKIIRASGFTSLDRHSFDTIKEPIPAAPRGRNPDNPSDRTAGTHTEQRLELNEDGITNTLTTVLKDNYIIEPAVFTTKRTEYGKQVRKDYESGLISESRHNMTFMEPRKDGVSNTLTSVQKDNYVIEPKIKLVGNAYYPNKNYGTGYAGATYDNSGILPTLTTMGGGNREPLIIQVGNLYPTKIYNNPQRGRIYSPSGCSPTLDTCQGSGREPKIYNGYRIRKLTPRECFRLMGVADEDFNKLHDISNTQLYKLAGNSIVVNVLAAIFQNLFINKTAKDTTIFDFCN